MTLSEQIDHDAIEAAKNAQPLVRDTLRLVKTAIKNNEIKSGVALTDEQVIDVLAKEVKQRQESIAAYRSANRPELAEQEEKEIEVLKWYLPEQMSEEQIKQLIEEAVLVTGAVGANDMGKVMSVLVPKTKGKADGAVISRLVKEKLA